ncbi:MAG: Npt1/Npt2 family nucleotide transporter [Parachlamydiaceae bacterium]
MAKSSTQTIISLIFVPAILLSVCLSGSSTLFLQAQKLLIATQGATIATLTTLVTVSRIIFVLSLFIISQYKPFEKVFKGTLLVFIGVVTFLSVLTSFQESLALKETSPILNSFLSSHTLQTYEPMIKSWSSSLLYVTLDLLSLNLFPLLVWGFMNRFVNLSTGIKYYLPVALILVLVDCLAVNLGLGLIGRLDWSLMSIIIPAIAFMILATVMFHWAWKRLPDHFLNSNESSIEPGKKQFPFLAGAYLLAGSLMIAHILTTFFKSPIEMPLSGFNPNSPSGSYILSIGLSSATTSILWIIMGTWLISKQGWHTTALYGSMSVLMGGLAFLCSSVVTKEAGSWLGQAFFIGLLFGTTSSLFFPLIQIAYLFIPSQTRFRAQILTEMIALPLMKAISLFAVQRMIIMFDSTSAISIYVKMFISILLVLLVVASSVIGKRYKDALPAISS